MNSDRREWVEELATRHGRMVLAAAQRVLGNMEDAEDVLQGVFLRLLDKRLEHESARDWGALLRVMATHAAIDLLRRRAKGKRQDSEVLDLLPDPGARSPVDIIEQRRLARLLREALAQLPPGEGEAFALRYFEDFTHGQIARHQGATANQVAVMLHRARRKLRQILEPMLAPSMARKD
ncbi:MAG: sigma-70 family RNA polymerase sigma factor [Gemmatimonadetes bacterium]|nr:sigma-70 family RNA polymerase sigma factor [Gemmatimonadota bacterium]